MALVQTVSASDLYTIAAQYGRADNFSRAQWEAIGEYLENLSEDTGENIELDIVAICCDYSAVESVDDFYNASSIDGDITQDEWAEMDEDEKLSAVEGYLQDNTQLIQCEADSIVWAAF